MFSATEAIGFIVTAAKTIYEFIKQAENNEGAAKELLARIGIIRQALIPLYKLDDEDKQYFEPGLNKIVVILQNTLNYIRPFLEKKSTKDKLVKIFHAKDVQNQFLIFSTELAEAIAQLNLGISSQHILAYTNHAQEVMQKLTSIELAVEAYKAVPRNESSPLNFPAAFGQILHQQEQHFFKISEKQILFAERQEALIEDQKKSQQKIDGFSERLKHLDENDERAATQLVNVLNKIEKFYKQQENLNSDQRYIIDEIEKQSIDVENININLNKIGQEQRYSQDQSLKVFNAVCLGLNLLESLDKKLDILSQQGQRVSDGISSIQKQQDHITQDMQKGLAQAAEIHSTTKNIEVIQDRLRADFVYLSSNTSELNQGIKSVHSVQINLQQGQETIKTRVEEAVQGTREISLRLRADSQMAEQRHQDMMDSLNNNTARQLEQFNQTQQMFSSFAQLFNAMELGKPAVTQGNAFVNRIALSDFKLGRVFSEDSVSKTYFGLYKGKNVIITVYENLTPKQFKEAQRVLINKNLEHNSIAAFRDAYIDPTNNKVFLFIENCEKGTLRNLLEEDKKLSILDKTKIAKSIAEGLACLHDDNNVVHRNLTSQSVLINSRNEAKLTSFIFAKVEDDAVATVRQLKQDDTYYRYKAPELIHGEAATTKSDVYSFAHLFWEILSGKLPYTNMSINEINISAIMGRRENLTSIPDFFSPLIESCWQQDPKNRPSMRDVVCQLNKVVLELTAQDQYEQALKQTDSKEALTLFQLAADKGHQKAIFKTAQMYLQKNDSRLAVHYFMQSSNPSAAFNLASIYAQGLGVQKNLDSALEFAEKAQKMFQDAKDMKNIEKTKTMIAKINSMLSDQLTQQIAIKNTN